MGTTLCLFACVLAAAQPAGRNALAPVPRLSRGQELVYSGSFTQEASGRGVQFKRTYQVESRVLVVDKGPKGAEVAVLTILKLPPPHTSRRTEPELTSVRLELAHLDPSGRIVFRSPKAATLPLDGPPTIEWGMIVAGPGGTKRSSNHWESSEEGRPALFWQVSGTETLAGTACSKVVGVQKSADWDQPRADSTAWRRTDTIWVLPNLGAAQRVERVIERRDPARKEPTEILVTRYDLDSRLVYPDPLLEDRRREIQEFRVLLDAAGPMLQDPENFPGEPFDALAGKIAYHLENHPATPYREAIVQLKKRLEAAKRGEAAAVEESDEPGPIAPVASLGRPAPDFVVTDLVTRDTVRLKHILGRPILLIFYSPSSRNAAEILRFGQSLAAGRGDRIRVLGAAIAEDTEPVLKQREDLHLSFPVLSGQGLRLTYTVDATPKFVVIDADGIIRTSYVGWGKETPDLVTEELSRSEKPAVRR